MTSENVVFGGGWFVFYFHEKSYFCSKIFSSLYFKLFHQLGQVKVCNETSTVTMWRKRIRTSKCNCFSKRRGKTDYLNLALKEGSIPMECITKFKWICATFLQCVNNMVIMVLLSMDFAFPYNLSLKFIFLPTANKQ